MPSNTIALADFAATLGASLARVWESKPAFARLYGGAGLGAWRDATGSDSRVLPSVALRGGARLGSEHFGAQLELDAYLGIGKLDQLFSSSVIWPLTNVLGGLYVAF